MIGKAILHYNIKEKLGEGGMGVVYLAEDTKLEREVAIKFLPHNITSGSEEKERFIIEAKAAAALNHPNITTIHSIEEEDGELFIVMEYVKGRELKEIIRSGPLSETRVSELAVQAGAALQTAHEKGIVHRDIKASNIMLTDSGQIKIMDFGLAKMKGMNQLTRVGSTVGTAAYMSPEQVRGEEADERSDIWSFGVLLYEMISGQQPFASHYEQAAMYAIMNEEPQALSELVADISPAMEFTVNKCLQKEAGARYQNFAELLTDLKEPQKIRSSEQEEQAAELPAGEQGRKWFSFIEGKNAAIALAIGVILVLIASSDKILKLPFFSSVPDEQHLLVLPLINIGSNDAQQAFCDGLVETITSNLTQMEQFHGSLWVVPASEVRKNKVNSPSEAFQTFGANLAISGSVQIVQKLIRVSLNLVDAENMRQLNSSVIDINKEDILALQDKSVSTVLEMLNLELNPDAKSIIGEASTSVPGAYEYYLQGMGYLKRYELETNLDAAITMFKQAVDQDPRFALAQAGLAEAYWRRFELTKDVRFTEFASEHGRIALQIDTALPHANNIMGMIHSGSGLYSEAVDDFKRSLEADPTNAAAHRGLAKAYEALGKLDEAEATYQKAIALKPGYWAGYNDLGVYYYRNSRYNEAISQFRQVTALTPDNYRGYNNLGGIYYLQERWPEAREMFERSFSLKKSYSVASNLGTLYFIEGNYSQAARTYETALELNDHDYLVWGNLAAAYQWTPGEGDKAPEKYREAIKKGEERKRLNPNDPEVVAYLASYYAEIGENEKAVDLLETWLKMDTENEYTMFQAASTYEQIGNREQALFWIGEAIKHGFSRSVIEHQPNLAGLLGDERFKKLVE